LGHSHIAFGQSKVFLVFHFLSEGQAPNRRTDMQRTIRNGGQYHIDSNNGKKKTKTKIKKQKQKRKSRTTGKEQKTIQKCKLQL